MFVRCLILIHFLLGCVTTLYAQKSPAYALDEKKALEAYKHELPRDYGYLYGKTYELYHYGLETSPLFNATLGMDGIIYSNGESYSATLMYDIYKDELVCLTDIFPASNFICLNNEVIDSFKVVAKPESKSPLQLRRETEFTFVKVNFSEIEQDVLANGFYETIKSGDKAIFVHHEAIQGNNEGEEAVIQGIFRYDYVRKKTLLLKGKYYDLNSKRKFLNQFPENKKAISKKLRSFHARFEDLSATQLLEAVNLITE